MVCKQRLDKTQLLSCFLHYNQFQICWMELINKDVFTILVLMFNYFRELFTLSESLYYQVERILEQRDDYVEVMFLGKMSLVHMSNLTYLHNNLIYSHELSYVKKKLCFYNVWLYYS